MKDISLSRYLLSIPPQFTSISMEKRKIPGKAFHPGEIRQEKDDRLPHGVQSGQLLYEPRRIPESDLHFVLFNLTCLCGIGIVAFRHWKSTTLHN